jgi:predicted MPP superfamily phosphohydrolase
MHVPIVHSRDQQPIDDYLIKRVGRVHLRQRLSLETEHETKVFRKGTHFFHLENWYSIHSLIRNSLRLVGLYGRGQRNALRVRIREHEVELAGLPAAFDGYTLLQISDPHVDVNPQTVDALIERVRALEYDTCVLTGDYRFRTFGEFEPTLEAMADLRSHLKDPVYAVLGNHDSIRMVPGLEAMGIHVLLNESVALKRQDAAIYLAGIDDAHYYQVDNIEKAAHDIPHEAFSILLSHTPEAYRNAAHAGFRLMLCGHTHGGQICLPGNIPVITDADCPRAFAAGPWKYHGLIGYTSVGAGVSIVDVRLNCLPEITLHRLRCV